MKIALIYATKHNHTKHVVDKIKVDFNFEIFDVKVNPAIEQYELILWFCPTYGDAELPLDMEDFLQKIKLTNKKFIVCELGNYYGYDDYQFGALKIIKSHLISLGWQESMEGLSLDSLPRINWDAYYAWCERLNGHVKKLNN